MNLPTIKRYNTTFVHEFRRLQKEVYDNAVAHGWWDKERPVPEMLALLHSEVSEAWLCVKNNDMVTTISEKGKPEGFPSEIADIVIRAMDMAGGANLDLALEFIEDDPAHSHQVHNINDYLLDIHMAISDALENIRSFGDNFYRKDLSIVVNQCFRIENVNGLLDKSLMDEIVLKHEYNKTRPYRHGNKSC